MINTIQDLGYSNYGETIEHWVEISKRDDLSVQFCEKNYEFIWWGACSAEQNLSDEFIQAHKDELDWYQISMCKNGLSEAFIEKYKDKVYWEEISEYQALSESFLAKHYKYVSWSCISRYQALSESFITIFADYVDWQDLQRNDKIQFSDKFKKKYANRLWVTD